MVTTTPKVAALVLGAVLLCFATVITPFLLFSNSTESIADKISVSGTPRSSASVPPQQLSSKTAVPNHSIHSHRSIDNPVKVRGFLSHYKFPVAIALGALVLAIVASIIVSLLVLSTEQSEATRANEDLTTEIKPEDHADPASMGELVDASPMPIFGIVAGVVLVAVGIITVTYMVYRRGGLGGCMIGERVDSVDDDFEEYDSDDYERKRRVKFDSFWNLLSQTPSRGKYFDWDDNGYFTMRQGVLKENSDLRFGEAALILLHNLPQEAKNGTFYLKFQNKDFDHYETKFWTEKIPTFQLQALGTNSDSQISYFLDQVKNLAKIYERINKVPEEDVELTGRLLFRQVTHSSLLKHRFAQANIYGCVW